MIPQSCTIKLKGLLLPIGGLDLESTLSVECDTKQGPHSCPPLSLSLSLPPLTQARYSTQSSMVFYCGVVVLESAFEL